MNIEIRHLTFDDYAELKKSMIDSYADIGGTFWKEETIKRLLEKFPEGQLCAVVDNVVVGSALSIKIPYSVSSTEHNYRTITGDYTLSTHNPKGDTMYGIEVFVHPDFRKLRIGRRLYDSRKELCEKLNLKSIVAGGRIPYYHKYSSTLSPKEFIEKVSSKEVYDPTLTFQLSNGFHVIRLMKNYLEGDIASEEYATLIEWNNIYYQSQKKLLNTGKEVVRLGLVQWLMRPIDTLDQFFEICEFYIDTVSRYRADFILFPELFNAPLLSQFNHMREYEAIRAMTVFTEPIKQKLSSFAIKYNVNIISGSLPQIQNGVLNNIGFVCKRNGDIEQYEKIHTTPAEKNEWDMVGGNTLKVFSTDCGNIGVLICYDIQFPELSRILAEENVNILFVPFLTSTQNGYTRVSRCAQARAIENECYVAIAGCVGNLPKIRNMDIQYAQSAVYTPADFAFPTDAVKAIATPNAEMCLIADVDLTLLKDLSINGSVTNLKDRRLDLFEVIRKK